MTNPRPVKPPDLYDVARLAGVSHQTVSRVVNSRPHVRAETRLRVQQAIAELGYRPNVAARSLVTRRSNTIGIMTSDSAFPNSGSALIGAERAARDTGYYLSVAGINTQDPATIDRVFQHFNDQGVDGIIVLAPEAAHAHRARPFTSAVPTVLVAAGAAPSLGVQITAIDQEKGARLATGHLIELGHTRIGHIAGPKSSFDAAARRQGWRREITDHGLRPGPLTVGDWSAASGHRIGTQLLQRKRLPSAIFAANDLMAIGFIRAMHDAGLNVPDQVSVIGFDDIPGVDHFLPRLSTIRQDLELLGQQCVETLLATLSHTTSEFTPPEPVLVARDSSRIR
jgi:DNA-binding LacI/PurR family transcriptional regulator